MSRIRSREVLGLLPTKHRKHRDRYDHTVWSSEYANATFPAIIHIPIYMIHKWYVFHTWLRAGPTV